MRINIRGFAMWKLLLMSILLLTLIGCSNPWEKSPSEGGPVGEGLGDVKTLSGGELVVGEERVVKSNGEEKVIPSKPRDYTLSAFPVKSGPKTVEASKDSPIGVSWIYPGKVWVTGIYPGARAEWPIRVHNGKDEEVPFSITYRRPARTLEGFSLAPEGAQAWVTAASVLPLIGPDETQEILIVLEIPEEAEVLEDKWEFWIVVKDTSQAGMVMTEMALRWLVEMR